MALQLALRGAPVTPVQNLWDLELVRGQDTGRFKQGTSLFIKKMYLKKVVGQGTSWSQETGSTRTTPNKHCKNWEGYELCVLKKNEKKMHVKKKKKTQKHVLCRNSYKRCM